MSASPLASLAANFGPLADQPLELRAGEIGVELEPGLAADQLLVAGIAQFAADRIAAAALPDDRVVQRPAGLAGRRRRTFRADS